MIKPFQEKTWFKFLYFGYWNLFDIWNLTFVILISE